MTNTRTLRKGDALKFTFSDGFHGRREDAQAVGEELQALRKKYGGLLTPEVVVEQAEREDSALHNYFEWDNDEAARKYRLDQARRIIRAIVIVDNGEKTPRRAFVHVEMEAASGYMDSVDALQDDALRLQVLEQARRELQSFTRKYAELTELAEVIAVARQTLRKLQQEVAE